MQLSPHFDSHEFDCPCCGKSPIDKALVEKLEKLFSEMNAHSIIITSGYRCPSYSPTVKGYSNDAHTKGIAADIVVYRNPTERYPSERVAYAAEKVGFSGIGIIDDTAVHVDIRNSGNYINAHWFGDERTGNDYIKSFADYPENKVTTNKSDAKVIDAILEIDGHKYTGMLTEE